MSVRSEVLIWAQRVLGRKSSAAHQLLEVAPNATLEQVQEAFHKIAKLAHPDLHRHALNADELETVTLAYSRAAGAYQEMKSQFHGRRPPPAAPVRVSPTTPVPAAPVTDKAVPV